MIDAVSDRLLAAHFNYRKEIAAILRALSDEDLDKVYVTFAHSNLRQIDQQFGLVAAQVRSGVSRERARRAAEAKEKQA